MWTKDSKANDQRCNVFLSGCRALELLGGEEAANQLNLFIREAAIPLTYTERPWWPKT